jgi:hypothetical protein
MPSDDEDDSVSQFITSLIQLEDEMENEEKALWEEAERLAEMRTKVVAEEEERRVKRPEGGRVKEAVDPASVIDASVTEWTWATWAIVVASFAYVIGWGINLWLEVADERTARAAAQATGSG